MSVAILSTVLPFLRNKLQPSSGINFTMRCGGGAVTRAASCRILSVCRIEDVNKYSLPRSPTKQGPFPSLPSFFFFKKKSCYFALCSIPKSLPDFSGSCRIFLKKPNFLHFIMMFAVSSSHASPLIHNIAHFHTIFAD